MINWKIFLLGMLWGGTCVAFGISVASCAHEAKASTYGNDTAATSVVVATGQSAAASDTTKTEK